MLSKQGVALIVRRPVSRSNQIPRAIINPVAVIHTPAFFFFLRPPLDPEMANYIDCM